MKNPIKAWKDRREAKKEAKDRMIAKIIFNDLLIKAHLESPIGPDQW